MQISSENFEKALFEKLLNDFPPPIYIVKFDDKILGKHSKVIRQIDVAVYLNQKNPKLLIVADAKRYTNGIHVKHIESFIGMFGDLNADIGIIAPIYYDKILVSKAAKQRILHLDIEILPIKLEDALILNWKETARKIVPYDWSYHTTLSKGLYYLDKNKIIQSIDALDNIIYDEWQSFVDYGLEFNREKTVRFLNVIMNNHHDVTWRFQAIANLFYNDLLTTSDIELILKKENDIEIHELLNI